MLARVGRRSGHRAIRFRRGCKAGARSSSARQLGPHAQDRREPADRLAEHRRGGQAGGAEGGVVDHRRRLVERDHQHVLRVAGREEGGEGRDRLVAGIAAGGVRLVGGAGLAADLVALRRRRPWRCRAPPPAAACRASRAEVRRPRSPGRPRRRRGVAGDDARVHPEAAVDQRSRRRRRGAAASPPCRGRRRW